MFMLKKKSLLALVGAAAFCLAGTATAGIVTVDFSPSAGNNGQGAISTTAPNFSAVGFQSDLTSLFTIGGTSGTVSVSETGTINITSFKDSTNTTVTSGVNSDYTLGATYSLSGNGMWSCNSILNTCTISLIPAGASLSVNLYANGTATHPDTGTLIGTASLDPSQPTIAYASVFTDPVGTSGSAITSLSASMNFSPDANYTGSNGFFQNLQPGGTYAIDFAVGNAGGNANNTLYSVSGGTMTIVTPAPGTNDGTANVTFVSTVPEPGALSLVGIALIGLAGVGMLRKRSSAA